MEIKAYALVKNDVVISKFFDTKRSVEETYAKKLEDNQFSIGVFVYDGEVEMIDESDYIELYTNKGGYTHWQRGWGFYADRVSDRWDEKYQDGDYIFKIRKDKVERTRWGSYTIDDTSNIDSMKKYKAPKEEEKVEEDVEVEVQQESNISKLKQQLNQAIEDITTETRRVGHIEFPNLNLIEGARPNPLAKPMRERPEGIIIHTPRRFHYRPLPNFWLQDLAISPSDNVMKTSGEENKLPPLKLTQEDLDCPF